MLAGNGKVIDLDVVVRFTSKVVRSLLSVISLSTVPSTLKISFAIALTLEKILQITLFAMPENRLSRLS